MRVVVTTPPAPLVALALVKQQLKISGSGEDTLLNAFIAAASAHIDGPDGWLGRAIGSQTIEAHCDAWSEIVLPYPPAISVTSVKYTDPDGAEQAIDSATYTLSGNILRPLMGASWPAMRDDVEGLRVTYQAGYQTTPAAIVAAVLLMVGDLYRNRETTAVVQMSQVPMSTSVEALLGPFRVFA